MNWISGAFFLLAIHSIVMAIFVPLNKEWYYRKAMQAGVEPNIAAAIGSKIILAMIGVAVGIWQFH